MNGGQAAAGRSTVCGAKQGFRDSKYVNKRGEAPCTKCNCTEHDGKNGPECTLYPYSSDCCKPKTPHHLIPKHGFYEGSGTTTLKITYPGPLCQPYDHKKAPCICLTGHDKSVGQHREIHAHYDAKEGRHKPPKEWPYSQARDTALDSMEAVGALKGKCDRECIKAQLDNYHQATCCVQEGDMLKRDCHTMAMPLPPPTTQSPGVP
jgi:hypothetical protein